MQRCISLSRFNVFNCLTMKYAKLRNSFPKVKPDGAYNIRSVCRLLGQPEKPLHRTTLYRWSIRGELQLHTDNNNRPFLYGWEILELWWRMSLNFIEGRIPPRWPSHDELQELCKES